MMAIMWGVPGCGDGGAGIQVSYRMVGAPAPLVGGACPREAAATAVDLATADRVRLTYLDADGELICDSVFPLANGAPPPLVAYPSTADAVTLVAEYFAGSALVGAGRSRPLSAEAARDLGAPVDIRITAAASHSCAASHLGRGRVFHTATRLPGGQILFVGGAAGLNSDDLVLEGGLYGVDAIEVYDPFDQTVTQLTASGFVPRAFHHAVVIGGTAAVPEVAIIGGAEVGTPTLAPLLTIAGATDAYRVNPGPSSRPAPAVRLTVDLAARTVTIAPLPAGSVPPRINEAFALVGDDGFAVAGGLTDSGVTAGASGTLAGFPAEELASFPLLVERVGATLSPVGDAALLLWGGERPAPAGTLREPGEVVLLEATPRTVPIALMAPSASPTVRAFHQAATAADGAVIIVGGFAVGELGALEPDPVFAQRVRGGPNTYTVDDLRVAGALPTPLGYTAAATTAQGEVLISGGSPPLGFGACPTDRAGLACAVGDAWMYRSGGTGLESIASLNTRRYGHTLIPLDDGTVLVAGGITDRDGVKVVSDLEIFDPRDLRDDPLSATSVGQRAGGEVARGGDDAPLAPCAVYVAAP